mmetsp:Transcript_51890/g.106543  ORF Transcript_51890/g.106543 Transcript_51890/m.106543 type:complete len:282 (+) Transcript_51890:1-846(+)
MKPCDLSSAESGDYVDLPLAGDLLVALLVWAKVGLQSGMAIWSEGPKLSPSDEASRSPEQQRRSSREARGSPSLRKGAPSEIKVVLECFGPSQELGLILAGSEDLPPIVSKVSSEGEIAKWNDANPDSQVKEFDRLLEVNGVSVRKVDEVYQVLRRAMPEGANLTLVLKRPKEYRVSLNEPSELGMELETIDVSEGNWLMISKIDSGAVKELNDAYRDRGIRKLDCIVEVDGTRGSAATLLEKIQTAKTNGSTLSMKLTRYYGSDELKKQKQLNQQKLAGN